MERLFGKLDNLTKDLLQVEYPGDFLLDIGWYPEYEPEGQFIIQSVKAGNWDKPMYKKSCTKAEQLRENNDEAINLANN